MSFPATRLRRLRRTDALRGMVRETRLSAADLIQPLFVRAGSGPATPIASLSEQYHHSIETLVEEARAVHAAGVPAVILFGIPDHKDEAASSAYDEEGIVQLGLRAIRLAVPELVLITDVCLCQYTSHGHCGVLRDGAVDNDLTLELLAQTAVSHAVAGADIVAPSDMMDGRVRAIRSALDQDGFGDVAILSYAAKYASGFYGPFRDAAESPPSFGDRSQYQMDPANRREALHEVALDVAEGADMLMVKPALPYLDVLSEVRQTFPLPVAAYQVSGEYAMLHAAAANGWLDLKRCALESLVSIKRAGADMILTYFAKDAARWLDGVE
jgi:porphobilinogen synthase